MDDKELKSCMASIEAETVKQEIDDIDKRIQAMEIELPETLLERIEKDTGFKVRKKRRFHSSQKIAVFFLAFLLAGGILCIVKPEVVTAIRNAWLYVSSQDTEQAVNIEMNEINEDEKEFYLTIVPEGFEITSYDAGWNLKRLLFRNEKQSQYITLTLYQPEYRLSLDNEDYEEYTDITIGDSNGKIVVKKEITTLVFFYNRQLYEIESNLSEEDIMDVAEKIIEGGGIKKK